MPLLRWQTPKAVYRLPRNTVRSSISNHLRSPLQMRNFSDKAVPYSGPPSYTTLARRFSSEPNPLSFFSPQKKGQKKPSRAGEFVDIHDVGGPDPKDYGVLMKDVDHGILESEISKLVGIPYLEEGTKAEAEYMPKKLCGFVYGPGFRMVFPCLLNIEEKARWVFFIVATGSPLTYISTQVAQAFGLGRYDERPWNSKIAGYPHPVHVAPSDSHFTGVNILGADFCVMNRLCPWVNDDFRTITYYFGKWWSVSSKRGEIC